MTAMALNMLCAMRVPASDPKPVVRKVDGGMTEQRLDWHLENWAEWQQRDRVGTGHNRRASGGMISGSHYGRPFDEMVQAADAKCAAAVEALLDGCSPAERCAVHHRYLAAVFRWRGIDPILDPVKALALSEAPYQRARTIIRNGLLKRGIP